MINSLKEILKIFFIKFGLEVHSFDANLSTDMQLARSLKKFNIDLVLDVGANVGQFALALRRTGYTGKIISFEPLADAYDTLIKNRGRDTLWDVYARGAIGDKDGEIVINIAGNSVSSSILPMLDSHIVAAPTSAYMSKEMVPMLRLDSITPEYFSVYKRPFLKIDTQGFEWHVLNGSVDSMPHICGVMLEMSLISLYEGQHLWEALLARMKQAGFTLWTIQPGFTDTATGQTLQFDGIFYRTH